MKKAAAIATAVIVAAAPSVKAQNVPPDTPVMEKHSDAIVMYLDFNDGTSSLAIGRSRSQTPAKDLVFANGMFGSKGLKKGTCMYALKGMIDPAAPGTVVFWVRLNAPAPKIMEKYDPGTTFFSLNISGAGRLLGHKQGRLDYGTGATMLRSELKNNAGKMESKAVWFGDSPRDWKVGEWRMYAFSWTPDTLSVSINGSEWKTVASKLSIKPGADGNFQIMGGNQGNGFDYTVDEVAVLNKNLTGAELKELFELYQAKMKEAR